MRRWLSLGSALFLLLALFCPSPADAQSREDTLVYALQSDVDTWDPPNSVLREAIILGYHVFDHLATRDLKTRKVIPNLATSWKPWRGLPRRRVNGPRPFILKRVAAAWATGSTAGLPRNGS